MNYTLKWCIVAIVLLQFEVGIEARGRGGGRSGGRGGIGGSGNKSIGDPTTTIIVVTVVFIVLSFIVLWCNLKYYGYCDTKEEEEPKNMATPQPPITHQKSTNDQDVPPPSYPNHQGGPPSTGYPDHQGVPPPTGYPDHQGVLPPSYHEHQGAPPPTEYPDHQGVPLPTGYPDQQGAPPPTGYSNHQDVPPVLHHLTMTTKVYLHPLTTKMYLQQLGTFHHHSQFQKDLLALQHWDQDTQPQKTVL